MNDYGVVKFSPYATSSTGSVTVGNYTVEKNGKMIVCTTNIGTNRWPAVWVKKNNEMIFKQASSSIEINKTEGAQQSLQDAETTYCWCIFSVGKGDSIVYGTEYNRAENHKGCFWLIATKGE